MTDHTPTPRTDTALTVARSATDGVADLYRAIVDHARTLERELAEAARGVLAQNAVVIAQAKRLADYQRLEAILEDRSDVRDGPEGTQLPNEAMSILTEWRGPV